MHHVKINNLTLKLVEKIINNKELYKAEIQSKIIYFYMMHFNHFILKI
jgi:hypothetical protein